MTTPTARGTLREWYAWLRALAEERKARATTPRERWEAQARITACKRATGEG